MRAGLSRHPIPDGLRESLLTEQAGSARTGSKLWVSVRWSRWAAVAALIVLVATGGAFGYRWQEMRTFHQTADFREAMTHYIAGIPFWLDLDSADLPTIDAWLERRGAPQRPAIGDGLAAKVPMGCKKIEWCTSTVALVCFRLGDAEDGLAHLFIVDKNDLAAARWGEVSASMEINGYRSIGWETETQLCLLVPSSPEVDLSLHLVEPILPASEV